MRGELLELIERDLAAGSGFHRRGRRQMIALGDTVETDNLAWEVETQYLLAGFRVFREALDRAGFYDEEFGKRIGVAEQAVATMVDSVGLHDRREAAELLARQAHGQTQRRQTAFLAGKTQSIQRYYRVFHARLQTLTGFLNHRTLIYIKIRP